MKILLVNLKPFVNVQGGVEKVFCLMANNFVERGYEVAFVGMDSQSGPPYFPISTKVNLHNKGNITVNKSLMHLIKRAFHFSKKKRHEFDSVAIAHSIALKLQNVFLQEKPDVTISFHIKDTHILKKYMNIECPVITMFHCIPTIYFKEIMFDEKIIRTTEKSDCLQVLLPSFIDDVRNYVKHENVIAIGNVVHQNKYMTSNHKGNIIINVGRVGKKDKRQHLLIEAFNKIHTLYPDWRVEFWGDTSSEEQYYEYCCNLIDKYGLSDKVRFCGITSDIIEKLKQASIFAFPSAYEGFSLALTEAMSLGLPCVGFKSCPSVNELIRDGNNGILCDDTVEGLAIGLTQLMDDVNKREKYGLQAKADMNKYAPENIWRQWEELINKTVIDYKLKYKD